MKTFLKQIGNFPDAEGRKHFLYALLDTCKYEIHCPRCNSPYKDIIGHILSDCKKSRQLMLQFQAQLVFYGVPSTLNFKDKTAIFFPHL